jgi:lipoyl-dependent peroxiredoxin
VETAQAAARPQPSAQVLSPSDAVFEGGATVVWTGDLPRGSGALRLERGAGGELPLVWPGSPAFGSGATTPEELAAAAYAACFTMTLAYSLARAGHAPRRIETAARATFGLVGGSRRIRSAQLELAVDADALDEPELGELTEQAGRHCPVSTTLRAGGVLLDVQARLGTGAHVAGV